MTGSFYDRHLMPCIVDFACGLKDIQEQRKKVVPAAEGRVLELGIGSGHNLPYYDPARVTALIGVDPDEQMWKRSAERRKSCAFPVERIGLSGEQVPLDDGSVDTVVITYSLCTIPDPVAALREARRIVRRGGRILFAEHGEAPTANVRRWQARIDPIWKKIAGGCHSGRPIPRYFEHAGLLVDRIEEGYIRGPKPLAYNYWGSARTA